MPDWPPDQPSDEQNDDSLLFRLRGELEESHEAWRKRWGPEEEHELYREIAEAFKPTLPSLEIDQHLADRIRELYEQSGTPRDGLGDLPSFVQALTSHPIVREGIELRYAYEALAMLRGLGRRLGHVLTLMTERQLSPQADRLIRQATHLYLWGLEGEAIIMCAASLEAAYVRQFPDEKMFALQIRKRQGAARYDVPQYLRAAKITKVFSSAQTGMADQIREARNRAVHSGVEQSDSTSPARLSSKKVLTATAELLQRLFPSS